MMVQPLFAFVDESGDPSLEIHKDGVTKHFIVVSIMVDMEAREDLHLQVEEIRKRHFQTGEIRSNKIGSNWTRRINILGDVLDLDFRAHVLLIHKERIDKDGGLRWKRSFLKYIHGLLYQRLFKAIPDLRVIADEHGSRAFMEGFRDYVKRRHIPDLFRHAEIYFENSKAQPLIQLADLLAGTIGQCLKTGADLSLDELLRSMERRIVTFVEWPPAVRPLLPISDDAEGQFDRLVRTHSLNQAAGFLEDHREREDLPTRCQVEVLRYLYFHAQFIAEDDYVSTRKLRRILESVTGASIKEHFFRTSIIAKLRDAGVLVASSPSGYKIPMNERDMRRFVEQANQIIEPLLSRVQKARAELMTASNGGLDILGEEQLRHLRKRPA